MKAMLKAGVVAAAVLGLSLSVTAAKMTKVVKTSVEKEFTFKGKVEATKVALDKQAAEKVAGKVTVSYEGKVIGTAEKLTFKQAAKNKDNWVAEFVVKGKAPEKANVKVKADVKATFKNNKFVEMVGDKKAAASKGVVDTGTVKVAPVKATAKKK